MSDSSGEVIVEIPQGKLRGKTEKSVFGTEFCSFQRIPYAKPPIGELRFKAPQPADGWKGIRDATSEGPVCPSLDWDDRTIYLKNADEDSLFVNVFCKQNPNSGGGKKRPVLVWIHGGGFEFGSGNKSETGPDYFLLQDIVLVTLNYRLGALGFLSLQTVECPGNFGLKDQQLALKWVKNNISFFGGNPENITIFGISAGGASVHYQTLSLSNKGLFQRAIAQSGLALPMWSFSRCPRENAFLLGKRLGCDTKDDRVLMDFLKKVPAKDIVIKSYGIIEETEGLILGEKYLILTFAPTVEPEHEGAFITKYPWDVLNEGKQLDVPLITGICSQEMIFGIRDKKCPKLETVEELRQLIPKDIKIRQDAEKAAAIAKLIKNFYFANGVQLDKYLDVLSDSFFNYSVYKIIKSRKNCKSPTYLYQFDFEGDQPTLKDKLNLRDVKGVSHGSDGSYLFLNKFSKIEKMRPGSRDYNFMNNFTKLWVNFATTGVPALEEPKLQWGPTSAEGLEYLDLDESLVTKKGLFRERMLFWDNIYTTYYR